MFAAKGSWLPLVECRAFNCRAMDKAFDANWLRDFLAERSIMAVIPPKSNRKNPASCDMEVYKWRHLIENFLQKLKEFKRIAMRACKTDTSFEAMMHIGATVIRTR